MKKIIVTEAQLSKIINEQFQKNGGTFTNVNDFQKAMKSLKKEGYRIYGTAKTFEVAYLEFMEQTISKGTPVNSLNIIVQSPNVGDQFLANKAGFPRQQFKILKQVSNGYDMILFYVPK